MAKRRFSAILVAIVLPGCGAVMLPRRLVLPDLELAGRHLRARAAVIEPEIVATNGIIHPIDGVATRHCMQISLNGPPECRDLARAGR